MIEKFMIEHCSPTLASIKTANLFGVKKDKIEDINDEIRLVNEQIEDKGVETIILKEDENRVLVYVCRKDKLAEDLNRPGVKHFLRKYGYETNEVEYSIERLKYRIKESDEFPHEIGLFLGYPLGDVIGFIDNGGKNSKCTGCWKVYCNQCQAVKIFAQFNKCKEVYQRLWTNGRRLDQLAVAVSK